MKIGQYKYIIYVVNRSVQSMKEFILTYNKELDLSDVLFLPDECNLQLIPEENHVLKDWGF